MTKAIFIRRRVSLIPTDSEGDDILRRIQYGQEVMIDVRAARNPRHHRLFFAILHKLVENTDFFVDIEDALKAVKVACQLVDTYIDETGRVIYILRSIAWERMGQVEFSKLFDLAINVACNRWLPGTDAEDLRDEIFAMCDAPGALGRRVR